MHILWINDDASLAGGCERYIFSTVQELRSRGIRSSVLYKPLKNADPSYLKAFDGAFPKVDLANQLAQLRPDLIYVHQLESVEALATIRQSGVPSIRFFHDHRLFCLRDYKYTTLGHHTCTRTVGWGCYPCLGFIRKSDSWPHLKLTRVATLLAEQRQNMFFHAFVVGSRYMADHVIAHGFEPAKLHVIPPFASIPHAQSSNPREPGLLLFVGQLIRGKGLDLLLRAMTKTQQKVQLLVAGTGKQKEIYENLCTRFELSSRVTFLGKQSENQLAKLYERVTAVAYPSRSPETFGLVGIEAMSYGTPVIASAVGGVGEWLKDGENGIAVPAGDDDSLARAIDRLVSDPTLASSMGERGRRLYEARFRPERHVDSLHALFSGLLGKIDPT